MPSTRKQKAKERSSRQLDIMSDVKTVDVMLGSYSRNDEVNDQSENELNLDSEFSRPQRNSNVTGEDFRSLLTNSMENSEIIIETTRLINEEISNQMLRRLNEIKTSLNSQIQDAITTAIASSVLPSIQNTLEMHGRATFQWWTEGLPGHKPAQRRPIPPWRTKGPVGYKGAPRLKSHRKRGKIVPGNSLCRKTEDKCLVRVQKTILVANKIAT